MTGSQDWQGQVGDVWAAEWRRTDRSFADIARHLSEAIDTVAPGGAFDALDIGSGAGSTALALATARPLARVTGIDLSAGLVAVATERAASLPAMCNTPCFRVGDVAEAAKRFGPFDLLVSRHGVMFFSDPVDAFGKLHAAARHGAPLVFTCFRDRGENSWAGLAGETAAGAPLPAQSDGPGPFAFRDPDRVAATLRAAGWRRAEARAIDCAFRVGGGDDPVADAIGYLERIGVTAGLLRALDPAAAAAARTRLAALAAAHRSADGVDLTAAIWLWTAQA